jgi:hypothetical protein
MRTMLLPVLLLTTLPMVVVAQQVPVPSASEGEVAGYEDNRDPAGHLDDGRLRVNLEARAAGWPPWGEDGPTVPAHVFAVEGAEAKDAEVVAALEVETPANLGLLLDEGFTTVMRDK